MCAALLEAAGILPDAQGRRIGVQGEQRQGAAGAAEGAEAAAAGGKAGEMAGEMAGSAAAVRYLHARRQLYDAMEAALLERGLALGVCCVVGVPAGAGTGWVLPCVCVPRGGPPLALSSNGASPASNEQQ